MFKIISQLFNCGIFFMKKKELNGKDGDVSRRDW